MFGHTLCPSFFKRMTNIMAHSLLLTMLSNRTKNNKRKILMKMLQFIDRYSKTLSLYNGYVPLDKFNWIRFFLKSLEWTGHGIPWLFLAPTMIYFSTTKTETFFFINITVALIFDLLVICIFKLSFKRSRPQYNEGDLPLSVSKVDSFSFPSGHATRGFMLLFLFLSYEKFQEYNVLIISWAFILAYSRIALGRHFITDVVAGCAIGWIEGIVMKNYISPLYEVFLY